MKPFPLIAIFLFCLTRAHGQERFHPSTVEMGGNASFQTESHQGEANIGRLTLSPEFNFYCITNGFYLGPLINVSVLWSGNYSSSVAVYGGDMGYVLPLGGGALPYFGFSLGRETEVYTVDSYTEDFSGLYLPIYVGMKFSVGEAFFLNLQPTFVYTNMVSREQSFGLQVGFTGLLGHSR